MTNDKPSALLVIGFIALPVVVVLTTYLDVGAWLFASTRAALLAGAAAGMVIGLASLLLHDRVHGFRPRVQDPSNGLRVQPGKVAGRREDPAPPRGPALASTC